MTTLVPIREALAEAYLGDTKVAKLLFSDPSTFDQRLVSLLQGLGQDIETPLPSAITTEDIAAVMRALDPLDNAKRVNILNYLLNAFSRQSFPISAYLNNKAMLYGVSSSGNVDLFAVNQYAFQIFGFNCIRDISVGSNSTPNGVDYRARYSFSMNARINPGDMPFTLTSSNQCVYISVPLDRFPADFFGANNFRLEQILVSLDVYDSNPRIFFSAHFEYLGSDLSTKIETHYGYFRLNNSSLDFVFPDLLWRDFLAYSSLVKSRICFDFTLSAGLTL